MITMYINYKTLLRYIYAFKVRVNNTTVDCETATQVYTQT